jgi:hypothetical protein
MNGDFYVGYVPSAPPGLGKILFRVAAGLLLAGTAVAAILILDQSFAASSFEFGT